MKTNEKKAEFKRAQTTRTQQKEIKKINTREREKERERENANTRKLSIFFRRVQLQSSAFRMPGKTDEPATKKPANGGRKSERASQRGAEAAPAAVLLLPTPLGDGGFNSS